MKGALLILAFSFIFIGFVGADTVKWQPGHYMLAGAMSMTQAENWYENQLSDMATFLENPYTKGLYVRIPWRSLEVEEGVYDFSDVDKALDLVKSYDKYLVVIVMERCFNGCSSANSPQYLVSNPAYNGGIEPMYKDKEKTIFKGNVIRLWDSVVIDRWIALIHEFGVRYDDDPNFIAIATPETAIAIDVANAEGYSHSKYKNQLKRQQNALASEMPRTLGLMGINFISGGLDGLLEMSDHLKTLGSSGFTHPDTAPSKAFYYFDAEEVVKNDIAIAPMMQIPQIQEHESEEFLYQFCMNKLGAHMIAWSREFYSKTGEQRPNYIEDYVLPVVNAHEGYTVTDCPSSFDACSGEVVPIDFCGNGDCISEDCSSCPEDCGACDASGYSYNVSATLKDFVIDGDLSEFADFDEIEIIGSNGTIGKYKLAYGKNALYIGAEVLDSKLNSQYFEDDLDLWMDDSIEIIFDTMHDKGSSLDDDDYKFIVNLNNARFDNENRDRSWNSDFDSRVLLDGTLNDDSDEDVGYSIEIRIPFWENLVVEGVWGMNIQMNDKVGGDRTPTQWADRGLATNVPDGWNEIFFEKRGCSSADSDGNGVVSTGELQGYILRWLGGELEISDLIVGVGEWRRGC